MNIHKISGLISAPFTPLQRDGSINLNVIESYAQHLVSTGVVGVFVCGTTGEGASLTLDERKAVAQRWVDVAGKSLKVIVHTGHPSLPEAQHLAAHAQKIGAYATAAMAPYFFKPSSAADLVEFCAALAAAAPAIPFYYYHIPSMSGVNIPIANFLPKASSISNLAGVKFTYENLMDFTASLAFDDGRYDMLFGRDEMLLAGLSVGAQGAVGSTYNYSAVIYNRLIEAFHAGDLEAARAEQALANKHIDIMIRYGGLPAGKAIMKLIGIDCGPARLPLRTLSAPQMSLLKQELEEAGFFEGAGVAH